MNILYYIKVNLVFSYMKNEGKLMQVNKVSIFTLLLDTNKSKLKTKENMREITPKLFSLCSLWCIFSLLWGKM